ncbi:hypothetical protein M378DRAFT_28008 [Amanita muscaria Koide BX008]|uniref:Ubiquitin-like domain-containing protein n=1 Tax=Amanita muscaria (strain Koide BX008) TaxID=946122 RepID=A0A0C2WM89_AMAMK|nr:hypothetical protein M378DRAFT_28008 [Amanita muscaria Koide BX008]
MGEVKLYFKLVETAQYVPSGSEGYTAEKDQTIQDLKTNVASYYDLQNLTPSWLFKLNSDAGVELDNSKTVKDCGLKDNDVLFIHDPDLVKISCVEQGATKSVIWVRRTDTVETVKNRAKASQAKDYDFVLQIQGSSRKLEDYSTVSPFVGNISLNLETSLKTPREILNGLVEGKYRLFNNKSNTYINVHPSNLIPIASSVQATYFRVELVSNAVTTAPTIHIFFLDDSGIRRYFSWIRYGHDTITVLSTESRTWNPKATNTGQTQRYSLDWSDAYYLTTDDSKLTQIYDHAGNNKYQDWSFLP